MQCENHEPERKFHSYSSTGQKKEHNILRTLQREQKKRTEKRERLRNCLRSRRNKIEFWTFHNLYGRIMSICVLLQCQLPCEKWISKFHAAIGKNKFFFLFSFCLRHSLCSTLSLSLFLSLGLSIFPNLLKNTVEQLLLIFVREMRWKREILIAE